MYQGLGFVAPPPRVRPNFRFPPRVRPNLGFFHKGRFGVATIDIVPTWAKKPQKDPKIMKNNQGCSRQPPNWSQYVTKSTQKSPKIGQDPPPSLHRNIRFPLEKHQFEAVDHAVDHDAWFSILEPGTKGPILSRQPRKMENVSQILNIHPHGHTHTHIHRGGGGTHHKAITTTTPTSTEGRGGNIMERTLGGGVPRTPVHISTVLMVRKRGTF